MMKLTEKLVDILKKPVALMCCMLLFRVAAFAGMPHSGAQLHIAQLVEQEPLRSGVVGVMAVTFCGDTLVDVNSSSRMVPASNMKLITTGSALKVLGPDYRFETRLAYDGAIIDSTLVGDLYIVGGGDPTTGAEVDCAEGTATLFGKWLRILQKNGIKAIRGRIVGDPRYFSGNPDSWSWTYDDLGTYYGTGPAGLNFFENAQHLKITPGRVPGAPVSVEAEYPEAPWMRLSSTCVTSPARNGDESVYVNTDLGPYGELRGRYAVDARSKTLECSNRFGAYTCAWYFRKYLTENGFPVKGPAADVSRYGKVRTDLAGIDGDAAKAAKDLVNLGSTWSPRLAEIVEETNHNSDNFFAETLLHAVGKKLQGSAQYDTCYVAVHDVLKSIGMTSLSACRIRDGSGLSRKNYVSPEFFVRFLKAMAGTPVYRCFLYSLPQPGGPGTLEYRMKASPDSVKERIHMKSGSMNGVRCFSGYIEPRDGNPDHTIAFSLMTNNITAGSWTMTTIIDDILASIAAEN